MAARGPGEQLSLKGLQAPIVEHRHTHQVRRLRAFAATDGGDVEGEALEFFRKASVFAPVSGPEVIR